ncbi:MAG TPA: NfeD family protein [Acidimicrobiales bacterium]|nr:NfeD family protein [Acidimicrobiales bacterium]
MWVVAGVLLGVVVLAALVGLHTGPHAHVAAAVAGVLAAAWLAYMLVDGAARPLLAALLAADVVVSGGVGVAAWKALTDPGRGGGARPSHDLDAAMGVAVGPLRPNGVVRVRGESWSATSVNGDVPDGAAVQVVSVDGIRLSVWREEPATFPGDALTREDEAPGTPAGRLDT